MAVSVPAPGAWRATHLGVVQVVEHHHAAVLRAPHGVELVVVPLTQRQERLRRGSRTHSGQASITRLCCSGIVSALQGANPSSI